jgi:hypothetical protein
MAQKAITTEQEELRKALAEWQALPRRIGMFVSDLFIRETDTMQLPRKQSLTTSEV